MKTVRCTTAEAIVRYLVAQRIEIDGVLQPLFSGAFAIFGHGNVTCLGPALDDVKDVFPTWRGQNEQGMALAAIAFAKAKRRRQIMVATSSIGPGATNMVTAAAVAHANRLPVLLLSGDTFASRIPDPVLQQVEHFDDPSLTVNDAFKPVTRYWDRIVTPAQVTHSLPHAVATMLDPATCGPAFLGLPQDVQGEAYDFPERFFAPAVHEIPRPRPDRGQLARASAALRDAAKPLIIAGGGIHYSFAEEQLRTFAETHNIPVVETVAGKASLLAAHPLNAGPIGVTGCTSANALAGEADVVLAVGTRLQDFTTGSWTVFRNEAVRFIGLNTATFDAVKHLALPLVADAREGLAELTAAVGGYRAADNWSELAAAETAEYHRYIDKIASPTAPAKEERPTYAQVIGAIDRLAEPSDYALSAAGGFPGELNNGWRAKGLNSFDSEYGYSCMGYEISGGWGAKMALPDREVIVFVGDGSYLMMNSDLYSSVLSGHKLIVLVCDNGGFAVINRLQVSQGGAPFNNLIADAKVAEVVDVDFAAHAAAMGCRAETVTSIPELEAAFQRARTADRTTVIAIKVSAYDWTEGGSFWEVGVPEVSDRASIREARQALDAGKAEQRVGW
ncbi:MAG TPA: 3D-(3,5/4)-trihydroxycyclohexane-1,2-dione acylhydrolase (decyclizing) [Acidimicrobiales bacterium]|nr:3D-(3,5/4)-trihydroxycyclohexane-1,2-dione acylhydrolase (decyclizing) [Acidimicrobiales bacterium]